MRATISIPSERKAYEIISSSLRFVPPLQALKESKKVGGEKDDEVKNILKKIKGVGQASVRDEVSVQKIESMLRLCTGESLELKKELEESNIASLMELGHVIPSQPLPTILQLVQTTTTTTTPSIKYYVKMTPATMVVVEEEGQAAADENEYQELVKLVGDLLCFDLTIEQFDNLAAQRVSKLSNERAGRLQLINKRVQGGMNVADGVGEGVGDEGVGE